MQGLYVFLVIPILQALACATKKAAYVSSPARDRNQGLSVLTTNTRAWPEMETCNSSPQTSVPPRMQESEHDTRSIFSSAKCHCNGRRKLVTQLPSTIYLDVVRHRKTLWSVFNAYDELPRVPICRRIKMHYEKEGMEHSSVGKGRV